jgi:hypothetical protein
MTSGWAQSKGASKHRQTPALSVKSQGQGAISLSFSSAPDGVALAGGAAGQRSLDLGTVSNAAGSHNANVQVQKMAGHFIASTKFALSIQASQQNSSTATVLAALAVPDPLFTFRLDGITLATAPQMIQGQARMGTTFTHRLEIDVPTSLTEKNSQLHNAIIFQVIPN